MYFLIARHRVEDYAKWRPVFDEHKDIEESYGLRDATVFRNADDPNDLVLRFRLESPDRAREFLASEELKEAMGRAGVIGKPEAYIVEEEQEEGTLRLRRAA